MNVIISCGGTGGHIYPGIAIADKIKKENPNANILFVGTKNGMENNLVPEAGYAIRGIDAKGIDRKHLLANFKTLNDTLHGGNEAADIINEFQPDIVIGTGGYVTGPVLLQAKMAKIPCFIHEQNAMPGVANRLISTFAKKVFVSFNGVGHYFAHPHRVVFSGNPVRAEFASLDRDKSRAELGLKDETMVLIFGGSLGAQLINQQAISMIGKLKQNDNTKIKVIFVTGNRYYDEIKADIDNRGGVPEFVDLKAYAYNMPTLMSAADIIVSRAGAIAVAELEACGRPGILIPSPNVTANHQYYNAKALSDNGAAVLLEEKVLVSGDRNLYDEVMNLANNPEKMASMASKAKSMGTMEAVDIIYNNLDID